jgi:hypothetical protein
VILINAAHRLLSLPRYAHDETILFFQSNAPAALNNNVDDDCLSRRLGLRVHPKNRAASTGRGRIMKLFKKLMFAIMVGVYLTDIGVIYIDEIAHIDKFLYTLSLPIGIVNRR